MIHIHSFLDSELTDIIAEGDIPESLRTSSTMAIFTQDWCPDWLQMRPWIEELKTKSQQSGNLCIGVYNTANCSEEFQSFKEEQWENGLIPYIRMYQNGELVEETNHIGRNAFFAFFPSAA